MDSKRSDKRFPIRRIGPDEFPGLLRHMPDPPTWLALRGVLPPAGHKILTIVGSRRFTDYGKEACEALVAGLRGLPVVIVSGLALGIDSIAHRAALRHGLLTIAVPGSGLDPSVMYPASHASLADDILEAGGALFSPFEDDAGATIWSFPLRNRIMAGMSHATLVIEAEIKSGTLITSKHASEFGRDVCAVPGSIFAPQSAGPHQLIRGGAIPITNAANLREALGFADKNVGEIRARSPEAQEDMSPGEKRIVGLLADPMPRDALYARMSEAGTGAAETSVLLSILEIKGLVEESLGEMRLI